MEQTLLQLETLWKCTFALTHGVPAAFWCETHVSSILVVVHSCIYVRYTSSLFMWKFYSKFAALRLLHAHVPSRNLPHLFMQRRYWVQTKTKPHRSKKFNLWVY